MPALTEINTPGYYKWFVIVDGTYYYEVGVEKINMIHSVATVEQFNAALANAVDGDTIMVASGSYSFENEVKVNKNVTIQGSTGTIFESNRNKVAIYIEDDADVTFDNITFKEAGYHYLAGRPNWSGSLTVTNCVFADGYGIYLGEGTGELIIDHCFFDDRDCAIGGLENGKTDWERLTITNTDFTGCNEAIGFKSNGTITAQEILEDLLANNNTGVGLDQIVDWYTPAP